MQYETCMFWVILFELVQNYWYFWCWLIVYSRVWMPHIWRIWLQTFFLTIGTSSKIPMLLDLMFSLFCSLTDISSCRYFGVELLIHLWVTVRILNCILCCIGSQCNALSDSVELCYFDHPGANVAHMFWILWNLLRVLFGMPYSTAFE